MGPEYTCVLDMCVLPKKGYSYIEAQSLYAWISHIHMSSIFYVVSLSMTLKLSLPLNMSTYLARIALYAEHVKSKWHSSSTMPSLHTLHAFKFVTFWYHDATSIPNLWDQVQSSVRALRALLLNQSINQWIITKHLLQWCRIGLYNGKRSRKSKLDSEIHNFDLPWVWSYSWE